MCGLIETPWDKRAFKFDTYEITKANGETFKKVEQLPGHFTVRVPPLQSKQALHNFGFYYCDTLIEPFCTVATFTPVFQDGIRVIEGLDVEPAQKMCQGVFSYDRYHRDFHIPRDAADRRYAYWIQDIAASGTLYGLWIDNKLAGFFACQNNKILLHAITTEYQGKGLAKYFWSEACQTMFNEGYEELESSISATNMPVVNLYRSLGFSFRNPMDIYHKFNPPRI
jgi:GNAT superfamily N-acetyltransferase